MELSPHSTVHAFFHEAVTAALRNQGLDATALTEFYVVNLLAEFARTPLDDAPLAIRFNEAVFALPEERARHLREVGDQSLYVSGFFPDSLQRGLVDVDYYIRIGETAYGHLARMGSAGTFGAVYRELAEKFARFVDVLAEVSSQAAVNNPRDVVALYERWLRTRSQWLERKLRAQGVLPNRGGDVQ